MRACKINPYLTTLLRRLLSASHSYVKHSAAGTTTFNKASLAALSRPKPERLHAENQQCLELGIKDHISYAIHKAEELRKGRILEEAKLEKALADRRQQEEHLSSFRATKHKVGTF